MTRDRLYAPAEWLGKAFEVVDTGGMIPFEKDMIPRKSSVRREWLLRKPLSSFWWWMRGRVWCLLMKNWHSWYAAPESRSAWL